ncbi:MAG: hypothetical protein K2M44_06195 [Clostridia bacterium]|nr:hypothetical protein [Clostridia bacterium]
MGELFNEFEYISSNGIPVVNSSPISYDGSYYISIVDYYGNVAQVTIVIDSVVPDNKLSGVSNCGSTSGKVVLSWDSLDAVQACLMDRNNNDISDNIAPDCKYEEEGAYYVRLTDICGNSVIVSFNIDRSVNYISDVVDGQVTTDRVTFKFNESVEVAVTRNGESIGGLSFVDAGAYSLTAFTFIAVSRGNVAQFTFCGDRLCTQSNKSSEYDSKYF